MNAAAWTAATTAPPLRVGEVHVWCASLAQPPAVRSWLERSLSTDDGREVATAGVVG